MLKRTHRHPNPVLALINIVLATNKLTINMGAVISALIAARVSSTQIFIIDSTPTQPVAQVILS